MPINETYLQHVASNSSRLDTVQFMNRNLSDDDVIVLADALETNTHVKILHLYGNQIGDPGTQALAEILKKNNSITTVILQNNNVGNAGAISTAEAVKANTSTAIEDINFSGNYIGVDGAKSLGKMLETNTSLLRLQLSGNFIRDDGAKAIAQALKKNTSLTELYVASCEMGEQGALALVEVLETNTSITRLEYKSNNTIDEITDITQKRIDVLILRNHALASSYEMAKNAYARAKNLVAKKAPGEEILKAFSTAEAKAKEGLEKYPPSKFLLARIQRDLKTYQDKASPAPEVSPKMPLGMPQPPAFLVLPSPPNSKHALNP